MDRVIDHWGVGGDRFSIASWNGVLDLDNEVVEGTLVREEDLPPPGRVDCTAKADIARYFSVCTADVEIRGFNALPPANFRSSLRLQKHGCSETPTPPPARTQYHRLLQVKECNLE
jgi:hypothetical protein